MHLATITMLLCYYGISCIVQTVVQLLFLKLKKQNNNNNNNNNRITTKTNFKAVVIAIVIIQILKNRGTSMHPIHFCCFDGC